jgi:hypothetical protein
MSIGRPSGTRGKRTRLQWGRGVWYILMHNAFVALCGSDLPEHAGQQTRSVTGSKRWGISHKLSRVKSRPTVLVDARGSFSTNISMIQNDIVLVRLSEEGS